MTNIWNFDARSDAAQIERTRWFNKVADHRNWKLPINCWIDPEHFDNCNQAAIWFTGSALTIVEKKVGVWHVQAPGYYATIGA